MSMDQGIAGAGMGALSGGASGAMIGGPVGAGVGAVAGGLLGYLGSNQGGFKLPWDQYNNRLAQIGQFQQQLTGANQQYLTAIGNMYNTAYNQYMPDMAAQFAGRGLNIDSGAFAAEAGRAAVGLTGQYNAQAYQSNINNINSVENQYSNAWNSMFGMAGQSSLAGFNNANANMGAIGSFAGQLALARYGNRQPQMAAAPGSSWGGGSMQYSQSPMSQGLSPYNPLDLSPLQAGQ